LTTSHANSTDWLLELGSLAAKDAEFQDKWRLMKQGQNKPLEEDEVAFLDTVAKQGMDHERAQRAAVDLEVQSFQVSSTNAAAFAVNLAPRRW
jgi:hypothetical protein